MSSRKKPRQERTYQEKYPYTELPSVMRQYIDTVDRAPLSPHGKEFAKEYIAVAHQTGNQADILLFLEQNAHHLTREDCRFLGSPEGSNLLSAFGTGYLIPMGALREMGEAEHISLEVVEREVGKARAEFHRLVDLQGGDYDWMSGK